MAKKKISSADLAWIISERLKIGPSRMTIAIVPDSKLGWLALTSNRSRSAQPENARRLEAIQNQLREVYKLVDD